MRNLDYWPPPQETVVPYGWTAEQANAVVELLEDLAEVIWARYGSAIASECDPRPGPFGDPSQLKLPLLPPWENAPCCEDDPYDDDDIPW